MESIVLCGCGCGLPAPIAKRDCPKRGHVRGQPLRYVVGHNSRGRCIPRHNFVYDGTPRLCACGCGEPTPLAKRTDGNREWRKGFPLKFIPGHGGGALHLMSGTITHSSWEAMLSRAAGRAINPQRYSGRGITVCDRWRRFDHFYEDMGDRPSSQHTLDRIDNDKGYEPGNCRWATKKEQDNNKSSNVRVTYNGETLTIAQWARRYGIHGRTLHNRLKRGGDEPPHLFRPVKKRLSRSGTTR